MDCLQSVAAEDRLMPAPGISYNGSKGRDFENGFARRTGDERLGSAGARFLE